ncbi:MAG: hypothetical protein KH338_09275 [Oscillospiraceae bacterium]|nr:hypothetical protein [Clostridiales bacterium]MBS6533803.1 hypothetical protein [Oscillospiraceae bacterium]
MNERIWERVSLAFGSCAPIEERLVFLGGVELFIQVCRAPAVWKPVAMVIQVRLEEPGMTQIQTFGSLEQARDTLEKWRNRI